MSARAPLPGDHVRTDWALGSPDGRTHYGYLLALSPGGELAKVDWNAPGALPRLVRTAILVPVRDDAARTV